MIRALHTGVSGLRSNQVRMDVVGNNIANVNTVAFKRGRATFNEVLGQELLGSGRMSGGTGVNPSFVGLGVKVSTIDQNWGQGGLQRTDIATDFALNGDGFFVASDGERNLLTRAGNFTFDRSGRLITSDGLKVQGWQLDPNGEIDMSQTQDIQVDWGAQSAPKATENVTVGGNLSAEAEGGHVETISRAVYDDQGVAHNAVIEFTKTENPNEWSYSVTYGGDVEPPPFSKEPPTGTITFDVDGSIKEIKNSDGVEETSLTVKWDGGFAAPEAAPEEGGESSPAAFNISLDDLTQYSGSTTALVREQDGYRAGLLEGYDIDQQGVLRLEYSNGEIEPLYQLSIANVNNPQGLDQLGENFYTITDQSGGMMLGRAGSEVQTAVVSGTLEMSNVDLANEFTDMIVSQRGYQAAARVITTSDELLQETVQLKR